MKRGFCATLALIGSGLISLAPAHAALISFVEDPAEAAPIKVSTDIAGASIDSSLGTATLKVGTVTGASTIVLDIALIQPGTKNQTGGGKGVSDILELLSFSSNGTVVGFEAIYQSDEGKKGLANPGFPKNPTFCSTTPGDGAPCAPGVANSEFLKTGALLEFLASSTLPGGTGPVGLTVDVRSPLQDVPEPASLPLIASGLVALGVLARRRDRVGA